MTEADGRYAGDYVSASWGGPKDREPPPPAPPPQRRKWLVWLRIGLVLAGFGAKIVARSHQHPEPQKVTPGWHRSGNVATTAQLEGAGRIYLVQLGPHTDSYTVQQLSEWLRDKYSLDARMLTATGLDTAGWDGARHRYVAEKLCEQIRRDHAALAADPGAWVIGFTDAKMYSAREAGHDVFSLRDGERTAIISSAGVDDSPVMRWLRRDANARPYSLLTGRLWRILVKDVAILYWHLPLNTDPGSLLNYAMDPRVKTDDLYESDLDPRGFRWGEFVGDPCVVLTYAAGRGIKASLDASSGALIQECRHPEDAGELQGSVDREPPDLAEERIEVRLRYGLLTEKHTDFHLAGPVPIQFERALSNRWLMPAAFGISGSHNYDRYLMTNDGMRHLQIVSAGSGDHMLVRTPEWLSLMPFNRWISVNRSGGSLSMRWRDEPKKHFELTRYNGEMDSYMPCTDAELCYLNGFRSSEGQTLSMRRDSQRSLLEVSASEGDWLHFTYDGEKRVTEMVDSRGRRVAYRYSAEGDLESVAYPSGETLHYTYDRLHNLLTLSVGTEAQGGSKVVLLRNEFWNGRVIRQTLAGGAVYGYGYLPEGGGEVSAVAVHMPSGEIDDVGFGTAGASVRRESARLD